MKAILLAGGRGSRLSPLTDETPKCLLEVKGTTPIERLVNQLDFCSEIVIVVSYLAEKIKNKLLGNTKITFITKNQFKENANRYSLLLALDYLKNSKEDIIIFETDMYAEDPLIDYVCGTDFDTKNTWFSSGKMKPTMCGGYLKTDGANNLVEIGYTPDGLKTDCYKMIGILRINKKKIMMTRNNLEGFCRLKGYTGYYLNSINANLDVNPFYLGDASHYDYLPFNTLEELKKIRDYKERPKKEQFRIIEMVPIDWLHPIEQCQNNRLKHVDLSEPLKIEFDNYLILDGHHRYQKAIKKDVKKLPVVPYHYRDVEVWSLREEIKISKKEVIENALKGNLYPPKTVKHRFP